MEIPLLAAGIQQVSLKVQKERQVKSHARRDKNVPFGTTLLGVPEHYQNLRHKCHALVM